MSRKGIGGKAEASASSTTTPPVSPPGTPPRTPKKGKGNGAGAASAATAPSTPPLTPTRRTDRMTGQDVTPTKWRVLNRVPDEAFFRLLQVETLTVCPDISVEVLDAVEKYYYLPFERDRTDTNFSILGTIEQETRTGVGIMGRDHRIKAYEFYRLLVSALGTIEDELATHGDRTPSNTLGILSNYLEALRIKLAEELKQISGPKKLEIEGLFKIKLDDLETPPLTPQQRHAVDVVNVSPVKPSSTFKTPEKVLKDRMSAHAAAKAAHSTDAAQRSILNASQRRVQRKKDEATARVKAAGLRLKAEIAAAKADDSNNSDDSDSDELYAVVGGFSLWGNWADEELFAPESADAAASSSPTATAAAGTELPKPNLFASYKKAAPTAAAADGVSPDADADSDASANKGNTLNKSQ